MAERRMFAKTIIDSDAFLEMPMSARLLYYDLAMRADDDGFINSPRKIMKFVGATNDDMNILIARKFIIPFDNGVVVIKHWRIHNYIRKDTYNETSYKEQKALLELDENKAYRLSNDLSVDGSLTQVSIGKVSIDNILCSNSLNEQDIEEQKKNEIGKQQQRKELESNFEIIYKSYPKKKGKARGFDLYKGWLKGRDISGRKIKLTNRQIWSAIAMYKKEIEENGTELQFVQQFDTFMNKTILDYVGDDTE
jgi:hypothetical protein